MIFTFNHFTISPIEFRLRCRYLDLAYNQTCAKAFGQDLDLVKVQINRGRRQIHDINQDNRNTTIIHVDLLKVEGQILIIRYT